MKDHFEWFRRLLGERARPERYAAPGPFNLPGHEYVCEWARANGLDPNDIPEDAIFEIQDRQITVDVVVRDAEGNTVPSSTHRNSVMKTKRTVPLRVPFPKEWS